MSYHPDDLYHRDVPAPLFASRRVSDENAYYRSSILSRYSASVYSIRSSPDTRSSTGTEVKKNLVPENRPRFQQWVPTTLRKWFLALVTLIAVGFLVGVEILRRISKNHQGLAFGATADGISSRAKFLCLNFPTILSVLYGMMWSWVDLDVKRMEPFFQLGKASGETARNSILLTYTTDFLPTVPLAAFRRRHWSVLYSSLATVLLFWFITPLQNAFITSTTIHQTRPANFSMVSSLGQPGELNKHLSAKFAYDTYNIAWLGQSLSPFTTNTSAFSHIVPVIPSSPLHMNETWSSPSVEYSTDLSCNQVADSSDKIVTINGNCSYDFRIATNGSFGFWAGYAPLLWENFDDRNNLIGDNCTFPDGSYFGAFFKVATANRTIGAFCRTKYTKQAVQIKTNSYGDIMEVSQRGAQEPLSPNEFNISFYEHVLSLRQAPYSSEFPVGSFPQIPLDVVGQMDYLSLSVPPPLLSYGLAYAGGNISNLQNISQIETAFKAAHRMLFATMLTNLQNSTSLSQQTEVVQGEIIAEAAALIVVQPLAVILEVLLGIVALLTVLMNINYWTRESPVASDPSSVSSIMSLVSESLRLHEKFKEGRPKNWNDLKSRLLMDNSRLRLGLWPGDGSFRLDVVRNPSNRESHTSNLEPNLGYDFAISPLRSSFTDKTDAPKSLWNPFKIGPAMGVMFLFYLGGVLLTILVLYVKNRLSNGLSVVTSNDTAFSILFNYFPTVVITFLGPCWIYLNRSLCMLQPLMSMRSDPAPASRSLSLRYTSYPPAFSVLRSLKAKHYLLASVCLVSLSTEFLTVAFGGLFNPAMLPVTASSSFKNLFRPEIRGSELRITNDPQLDTPTAVANPWSFAQSNAPLYKTGAAVFGTVPFPPWTLGGKFFLPFELPKSSLKDTVLASRTTGIRGRLDCLPLDASNTTISFSSSNRNSSTLPGNSLNYNMTFSVVLPDTPKLSCLVVGEGQVLGNGAVTAEFYSQAHAANSNSSGCEEIIQATWFRGNGNVSEADITIDNASLGRTGRQDITNISFESAICRQQILSADFDVNVNSRGEVLAYKQQSDWSTKNLTILNGTTHDLFQNMAAGYGYNLGKKFHVSTFTEQSIVFHNDKAPKDWSTYIMSKIANTTDLLDPLKPLPNFTYTSAAFSLVYSHLLASALAENTSALFEPAAAANNTIQGSVIHKTPRVVMSSGFFGLSVAVLVTCLIVASVVFFIQLRGELPDMPSSIAGQIWLLVDSNALVDAQRIAHLGRRSRDDFFDNLRSRYGLKRTSSDFERRWEVYKM